MALCTLAEIDQLESLFNVRFPHVYKAFLLGNHPRVEAHMIGTDMDMEHLPQLRQAAHELLVENEVQFTLSDRHFVFLMHQGYQFMYFPCDGSDDPPIFYYLEGERSPVKKFEHFSEWIALCEAEYRQSTNSA